MSSRCEVCGGPLPTEAMSTRQYCRPACKVAAHRQKRLDGFNLARRFHAAIRANDPKALAAVVADADRFFVTQ
jgi:hypothetical protein